jgi:predicted ArsR family transcriptional regulator
LNIWRGRATVVGVHDDPSRDPSRGPSRDASGSAVSLAVLKALGDDTRYAMYQELARSTAALSAQDLADALGIHANTVRLHLDRLREAGIVDVEAVHRGTVGRPQHLYFLAAGAPGLGFDPPAHALLAGLLAAMAERVGADETDAVATGRAWGVERGTLARTRDGARALEIELGRLGFEPATETTPAAASGKAGAGGCTRIEFLHCPFRELAEAYPELVCNLHRGLCEGVVDAVGGGRVEEFATLYDPEPCHVMVGVG